jgi:hypothetical protein
LTNVDPRRPLPLAACLCLLAWAAAGQAQNPTRTIAQFTRGDIHFTQGDKAYSASLVSGGIDVTEELAGEAPLEIRTLQLRFAFLKGAAGAQPDITIVLKNADGPGVYESSDLLMFTVQTSGGGVSTFEAGLGTCTFTLTRLARTGVDGAAACQGTMADAGGGQGLMVTDVTFSARP